ncbi:MAG: hypothetical protein ACLUFN_08465, partial [Eubacterium sp.]
MKSKMFRKTIAYYIVIIMAALSLLFPFSAAANDVSDKNNISNAQHKHSYSTITTKATLSRNGKKVRKCSECGASETVLTIYRPQTIYLSKTKYIYDGKEKMPSVIVKDLNGKSLKSGTDYTASYASGRKECGTHTVTVTFKGNYSGKKSLEFKISLGKVEELERQDGNYMNLNWRKVTGATGYEVYV